MNQSHISSKTKNYIIAIGIIGNLLDMYDVMLCALLAPLIAKNFFPQHDSGIGDLLNVFYVFLVGYLSRPIGSFLISLFADQIGRKKILLISIFIVGMSTTFIGLIPSYHSIGILSIIFFLALRILQNVFAGGEYISSIAYLIESADKDKKGFLGCWAAVGVNAGTLLASLMTFIITYFLETKIIPEWGWRLAFMPALLGMGVGLWMRLSIPESIAFILENSNITKTKKMEILKNSIKVIHSLPLDCVAISGITWLGVCITSAFFIYSPIHMTTVNHFSKHEALSITTISLLLLVIFIPVFGFISDRMNKVTLLKIISGILFVLAFPYYWYLSYGDYEKVLLLQILISFPSACFFSVAPVIIAETFPLRVRCTTTSLIYQLVSSISAGITPLLLLKLVKHNPCYPSYFIALSSVIGFLCLFLFKNHFKRSHQSSVQYEGLHT